MNIAITTYHMDGPQRDGIGNYEYYLTQNLIAVAPREMKFHWIHHTKSKLPQYDCYHDIIIPYPKNIAKKLLIYPLHLHVVLKNHNIDLVHMTEPAAKYSGMINMKGVKKILTIHDISKAIHRKSLPYKFYSNPRSCFYNKLSLHFLKVAIHKADLIIAISENTKEALVNYYNLPPN